MRIEWPPGSGRAADYDAAEQALMLRIAQAGDEAGQELRNLHELKVEFGVNLAADEPVEEEEIFPQPEFFPLPDPGRAEIGAFHGPASDAPETERRAALLQYPKTGSDRRRVLDHLLAVEGATDEEVSIELGMRLYTAAPRRNELVRDGWVEDSEQRRPTTTGSNAVVWRVTEQGREQAHQLA